MNAFIFMLPAAIVLALAGLAAFGWAMKAGQFDDPKGAAFRILDDTDRPD